MSESNGTSVWVSDLDRCISIDFDLADDDQELSKIELELDDIGDIELLAGKSISARQLYQKNISPSEWRHALHQAEMTIGFISSKVSHHASDCTDSSAARFIKGMLDLGRPYAIARYARWEHLDYPSALSSTLPHGIRALINQLLASEGIERNGNVEVVIRSVLQPCANGDMTAYRRTGMLQTALHRIADEAPNHPGGIHLDRLRMRDMLSLARLHFSTSELKITSVNELRLLLNNYIIERKIARQDNIRATTNGRLIKSWRLRHLQPLFNIYPYSVRYGLERALAHESANFDRTTLVNELALSHCGILRMRSAGKSRDLSK